MLTAVVITGTIFYYLLFPVLTGSAAPTVLPNCGQNAVTGSQNSGPPDMARSRDAAQTNTAIVWAEGLNGVGQLKLVYSSKSASDRKWTGLIIDNTLVDGGANNQNPSVAFDPNDINTVHVAYQKKTAGLSNGGIMYAKCSLTGGCTLKRVFSSGSATFNRTNPQIAVNAVGDPVIVYQNVDTSVLPNRSQLRYGFIENKGAGTIHQGIDPAILPNNEASQRERNPTVAYNNNKVHVALTLANSSEVAQAIQYFTLNAAGNLSGASLTGADFKQFNAGPGVGEPDFPALAALEQANSVALVWQVKNNSSGFNLPYNISNNNGVSWVYDGSFVYRFIPSNRASNIGPASTDARPNSIATNDIFKGNLHPDVALHWNGSTAVTHVAWHEEKPGSNPPATQGVDVMYSYFVNSQNPDTTTWSGTPVLSGTTSAITMTSVTEVYNREGVPDEFPGKYDHSALPKILFGEPGDRLQVIALSIRGSGLNLIRQLTYNGWQLNSSGLSGAPGSDARDSDCDTHTDSEELNPLPACGVPLESEFNSRNEYDCESDGVPDFLDTNVENDFLQDDISPDNALPNWRSFDENNGIYLPIIKKG